MGAIEWKRPGEIAESPAREGLGLEQRGDRNPLRTLRGLAPSQLETLVRLDVRPERDAQPFRAIGHVFQIALHHVVIQEQRRSLDVDHADIRTSSRAWLPTGPVLNTTFCRVMTD